MKSTIVIMIVHLFAGCHLALAQQNGYENYLYQVIGIDTTYLIDDNIILVRSGSDTMVFIYSKTCDSFDKVKSIKKDLTFFVNGMSIRKRELPFYISDSITIPSFAPIYYVKCSD